ncbi:hypothetical protein D3C78_1243170 [compost metagenome]
MSVSLIQLAFSFQCSFSIAITPVLVDQTNNTAGSDFSFVLIILLNEAFRVKQSDIVHMVEPAEIFFLSRTTEVISYFLCIDIDCIFTIIRGACSSESRISHCNVHVPIVCI